MDEGIDLSVLRADPDVTMTKDIRGIEFVFRTRIPAKEVRDMDMNPDTNPDWEYDLQRAVVEFPVLSRDDMDELDATVYADIMVECLDIAGLNARPSFR